MADNKNLDAIKILESLNQQRNAQQDNKPVSAIDKLKQLSKGREEARPIDTLRSILDKSYTQKIDPESALFVADAINRKNFMIKENGTPPQLPAGAMLIPQDALPKDDLRFKPYEVMPEKEKDYLAKYENVRTAFLKPTTVTNIDDVARDFISLSREKQDAILESVSNEDDKRTLLAIGDLINQDLVNLDLRDPKNKERVRKSIVYGYAPKAKKEWSREAMLESSYKDLAYPAVGGVEAYENHLKVAKNVKVLSDEASAKLGELVSDFALGVALGGAFAPKIMAKTGMSAYKYAASVVATEATLTGAAEKLTERYGMKGLLPLIPMAMILAPETIAGFSKFAARELPKIIAKKQYTARDMLALTVKGSDENLDKFYDTTQIGFKMTDEAADEISKNFGRQVAAMMESRQMKARDTALATIESTKDEYDAMKLPLKTRLRPTTNTDNTARITKISPELDDAGNYKVNIDEIPTNPKELLEEEFFARTLQAGSSVIDPRIYNDVKNLTYMNRIASGIRDMNEKITYFDSRNLIRQLGRANDPKERQSIIRKYLNYINNGVTDVNRHTDRIINNVDFNEAVEEFINITNTKGVGKHLFDTTFWNGFMYNPFYGTNLDNLLRNDIAYIDNLSKRISRDLEDLHRQILKGLTKEEKRVLNELLEKGTDMGVSFKSIEDVAYLDEALRARVNDNVFRAYKETREVFDFMGEHLAKSHADKLAKEGYKIIERGDYKYSIVKPSKEKITTEDGVTQIKVKDLENGVDLYVTENALKDIDYRRFLLEGYAPRIPKGRYNITILDKTGKKVSPSDLPDNVASEIRGFSKSSEAIDYAKTIEPDLPAGSQVVIHHQFRSPIPTGSKKHLLQEIDEYADINEADEFVDMFKATNATDEQVEKFIDTLSVEQIKKLQETIAFNRVQSGSTRFMKKRVVRPENMEDMKQDVTKYIKERLEVEKAFEQYANAFAKNISIDRLRDRLKMDFIKKFGHMLQRDDLGNVDWTSFNKKAFRDADSTTRKTAKLIQDQLKRIHKMPTDMEIAVNDWFTSLKEKHYRKLLRDYDPNISTRLLLSSDISRELNNRIVAGLGTIMLFFEPFYVVLQGFQAVPTLIANADVAGEALTKSITTATKSIVRSLPAFRTNRKLFDEEFELLKKAGLFENVELENAMGMYKFSKLSSTPMVWGEKAQRLVAGHVALAKARQLGLKGDELEKFIYDYGTKYALDMSDYSKRAMSEGFFKWNIGLFSRYFTQTAELFWKGMPIDKRIAVGLTLYNLFGINGIPFLGDARNLYQNNRNLFVNFSANLGMMLNQFEQEALDKDPAKLVDAVYPNLDPTVRDNLIKQVRDDIKYRKQLLAEAKERNVTDALENTKGIVDFFDKIFFKEGAISTMAGRLAYNDFITQKLRDQTFNTPLLLLKSAVGAGNLAIDMIRAGYYTTFGLDAPDEMRTEAYKDLLNSFRKAIRDTSPNMYDLLQAGLVAANLTRENWRDLGVFAGQEWITTAKGTKLKKMEDADIYDVIRLASGYGYRDIFHMREVDYDIETMLGALRKQAEQEAQAVGEQFALGNAIKAHDMNEFYQYRNKVFYGDSISAKLYHNTYLKALAQYFEANREPLANAYNETKLRQLDYHLDKLHGVQLFEDRWDDNY